MEYRVENDHSPFLSQNNLIDDDPFNIEQREMISSINNNNNKPNNHFEGNKIFQEPFQLGEFNNFHHQHLQHLQQKRIIPSPPPIHAFMQKQYNPILIKQENIKQENSYSEKNIIQQNNKIQVNKMHKNNYNNFLQISQNEMKTNNSYNFNNFSNSSSPFHQMNPYHPPLVNSNLSVDGISKFEDNFDFHLHDNKKPLFTTNHSPNKIPSKKIETHKKKINQISNKSPPSISSPINTKITKKNLKIQMAQKVDSLKLENQDLEKQFLILLSTNKTLKIQLEQMWNILQSNQKLFEEANKDPLLIPLEKFQRKGNVY